MNNYENLRVKGMRHNYELWLADHPDAISYDQLLEFIVSGDQFGRKVPVTVLAMLCQTSKTTMLKWLPIIKEELKEAK